MSLTNDTSFHWVVRRIGMISLFVLAVFNILTIVVAVIFSANTPSGGSNVLAQIFITFDALVFWLMSGCIVISGILWLTSYNARIYVRAALVWIVILFGIGGIGWWLLRVLTATAGVPATG